MKHRFIRVLSLILLLPLMPILGAIKVKDIGASTTKWNENASRAGAEYGANAEAAADTWAGNTARAADTFGQAITAANIKERFRRGVVKAGAAKYARKIRDVAVNRFGPGISAAIDDYKTGAEPYFSTLSALTLSSRKPRGDPANYNRVMEVGKALNAKRLAMLGTGGG
jgi:hypothetical protein